MCGLFGFVGTSNDNPRPRLTTLRRAAVAAMARGPHSFGMAWIDARNRLRMFKDVGRIRDNLDLLDDMADAKVIIGHCRWATTGKVNRLNAHPHPSDGGWIVHNGTIRDADAMALEYNLTPSTYCDSELIGLLAEVSDERTMGDRFVDACRTACDWNGVPMAAMGLWRNPSPRVVIVRAGKDLHWQRRDDNMYFCTLARGLKGKRHAVPNYSAVSIGTQSIKTYKL